MTRDVQRFTAMRDRLNQRLLDAMEEDGHWEGELSTSALSTATAVVALSRTDHAAHQHLIRDGLLWLATNANQDGGWGDTPDSFSNISTTALVWASFAVWPNPDEAMKQAIAGAEAWLSRAAGGVDPQTIAAAIMARYATDHTFSVPILTMLAICGRLGDDGWKHVTPLPFELAAAPQRLYKWLQLPVVSYALPALIAIGQVIHHKRGTLNPITAVLRKLTAAKTLRTLNRLQPANGGFLEAIPLTSFVTMSLAHMDRRDHPVVARGIQFLKDRVRPDGSWPIDTHLATWLTSLSVNALGERLPQEHHATITGWLLKQQYKQVHPFTGAAPGGWAWTPLPGGVPDADDTSGAVVALCHLDPEHSREAAADGIEWLLGLQNRDGGLPTFCKGWGTLPFDKSCADITAHGLAAIWSWRGLNLQRPHWAKAVTRMIHYLERHQDARGFWLPLWFGNQHHSQEHNPVYGTSRVLLALQQQENQTEAERTRIAHMIAKGRAWLIAQANPVGSWGGARELPGSIEETALAIDALCSFPTLIEAERAVVEAGLQWLAEQTADGNHTPAAPIGFYFANLWYDEKAYPHIFATSACNKASRHIHISGTVPDFQTET